MSYTQPFLPQVCALAPENLADVEQFLTQALIFHGFVSLRVCYEVAVFYIRVSSCNFHVCIGFLRLKRVVYMHKIKGLNSQVYWPSLQDGCSVIHAA